MFIKIISGDLELANKYKIQLRNQDINSNPKFILSFHHTPGNIYLISSYGDDSVGKTDILVKYYDNGVFQDGEVHPKVRKKTPDGIDKAYPDSWWKDLGFEPKVIFDSTVEGRLPDDYELNDIIGNGVKKEEEKLYLDPDTNEVLDSWFKNNVNTNEFQ
mgnify:CR=1 FL=1|tara:strand:- start:877 stop:1353 length:477 start_codon:yes stop_codon:yes gene_type:complete